MPYCDDLAYEPVASLSAASPQGLRHKRIAVISAGVGAGHDGAAAGLATRLAAHGFLVDRYDFLDLLPARMGKLLCGLYHRLLTWAPAGYQRLYATTEHARRPGVMWRILFRGAERSMLRALPADTCAVVSTYPGASQVLGALRRRGLLTVPAFTYLTDFSVHALWVAPGIDAHLAVHPVPAAQAHAQGAAAVAVTGPVTDPRFTPATRARRRTARTRFGLPEHAPLALVVAGSWGVGPIRRAATEIRDSKVAVPVVVCGRNQTLADQLRRDGIEHVFDWVGDMPALMHACDILVQNAGGLTSLEAFASGLPVASYRCIPGHGQTNAAALDEAGLATWIREPAELGPALTELLHGPRGQAQREAGLALHRSALGPVPVIAATASHQPTLHTWTTGNRRTVGRRIGLMAAAVAVTFSLGIAAPLAYAYAETPAHLPTVTHHLHEAER
ncbi:MGDG synthase family glycosyltransferase [Streptomyces silvisoli]|uniref:UDP-N-acetylglucosamine--N-acetylglucosamine transferase n=1 Tax=Streptomyces silvisoli TaxID=3034235 RepID=A0ABT5ZP26_9ACTN|nr:glycosyltransferase [Streptomyces silvisoli]MDF3291582.1 UDP-N-acetylglucosamine--N-acetylglucosamine transferase [Streptomyces silvisoli]